MPKKRDRSKKRRRERAEPPGAMAMVDANDPVTEVGPDPHGAAAIPPVTEEMMRHAAHAAAELADGVARGIVPLPHPAPEEARPAAAAPRPAPGAPERLAAADASPSAPGEAAARQLEGALGQYGAKLLDAARVNMAAANAHAAALAGAKSVPDAVAINADHVRRQVETLTGQARELSLLAQRALLEALQPFKGVLPRG